MQMYQSKVTTKEKISFQTLFEIQTFLEERPFVTVLLDSGKSWDEFIESLNNSLKDHDLKIRFEYNIQEIADIPLITNKKLAYILVKSNKWSGDSNQFSREIIEDPEFCSVMIKNKRWNQRTFFTDNILDSIKFWESMIETDFWPGDCTLISKRLLNNIDFVEKLFNNHRWKRDIENIPKSVLCHHRINKLLVNF